MPWITTPKTEKVLNILHDLQREFMDDDAYSDTYHALHIAILIIQYHRKETEDTIKLGIDAVHKLNQLGRFLTRFTKIHEEVK